MVNKLIIAALVGSALVLLGSFLVWGTAELTVPGPDGEPHTETGEANGMDGDGMYTLIASIVAIALLGFGMLKKNATIAAASVVPSLAALVVGIMNAMDAERIIRPSAEKDAPDGTPQEEVDAYVEAILENADLSGGIGLYIVLAGSVIALAAGVMVAVKGRANR